MSYKFVIVTNKYENTQLSGYEQKTVQELFENDIFKVVMSEKKSNNRPIFNSDFTCSINNLYSDKVYTKSCLVVYI